MRRERVAAALGVSEAELNALVEDVIEHGHRRLAVLAIGIRDAVNAGDAVGAGRQLIEAKEILLRGHFGPWLRDCVAIDPATARRFMRTAKSHAGAGFL